MTFLCAAKSQYHIRLLNYLISFSKYAVYYNNSYKLTPRVEPSGNMHKQSLPTGVCDGRLWNQQAEVEKGWGKTR